MVLVVAGLAIIASMMGIFNLGHGEFVLLGAFTVYVFREIGLPVWSGMLAAPILVALFGLAIEATIIRRLYRTPIVAMLATFAIGLIVRETVRSLIGGQYHAIAEPLGGGFTVLGAQPVGLARRHHRLDAGSHGGVLPPADAHERRPPDPRARWRTPRSRAPRASPRDASTRSPSPSAPRSPASRARSWSRCSRSRPTSACASSCRRSCR